MKGRKMEITLYKTKELPDKKKMLEAKEEIAIGYKQEINVLKNRIRKCEHIGLREQTKHAEKMLNELSGKIRHECPLGPAMFYPVISDEEKNIWAAWLPTSYMSESSNTQVKELRSYNFDAIPEGVLNEWQLAKSLDLFEEYEIRTPERQVQDPILIGWNNKIPYLIARWGESLIPFEEISKSVYRDESSEKFYNRFAFATGLLIFALLSIHIWREPEITDISSKIIGLIVIGGIISFIGGVLLGFPLSFLAFWLKEKITNTLRRKS
jgi:hypothetical protein